ncbi:MAG: glycosyltransferase family 4 protein [Alphaproteobacteria bacterium]|nr:glycosyltransferase family 4 protein [Alphaproteobacteria bacterium]
MTGQKILYIFDAVDWDSRIPVALEAREQGHDVIIGLIGNADKITDTLAFDIRPLSKPSFKPHSLSPLKSVREKRALIKDIKPDIMHVVPLKYGFLAGLAAYKLGDFKKIYTLAGLGFLFRSNTKSSLALRGAVKPMLSYVLTKPCTHLIFQNSDDLKLMVRKKYAHEQRCHLILGSGVHIDRFTQESEEGDVPIVLMPTRLVREKGVSVFVEAARILKAKGVNARFQIAGGETDNPKAISRAEMLEMTKDGAVEWLGRVEDMPELLSRTSLVVYPSYYGEGIPRVLLESCAAGKAIVTTDHPGCREAVRHGENGLLVPIKDAQATASAIGELLSKPEKRRQMGVYSRERAEKEFDINIIAAQTAALYKL